MDLNLNQHVAGQQREARDEACNRNPKGDCEAVRRCNVSAQFEQEKCNIDEGENRQGNSRRPFSQVCDREGQGQDQDQSGDGACGDDRRPCFWMNFGKNSWGGPLFA